MTDTDPLIIEPEYWLLMRPGGLRLGVAGVGDHELLAVRGGLHVGWIPGGGDEPSHRARVEIDDGDRVLTRFGDVQRLAVRAHVDTVGDDTLLARSGDQ